MFSRFVLWFIYLIMRGGINMQALATIYVALIVAGRRTFESVPEANGLKDLVRADLEALGYDFIK